GLSNEKLRDEILCQLVNQTWRNDNTASCERGWLLMANCLSVFPPSAPLYKFLLKYVSDHAYNGYKQICQRKLLQSHNQWARSCPPSLLEWRANRKRVNMALQLNFADGESIMTGVDSWSRCENLCSAVLAERGVAECHGWTISMERSNSKTADHRNGLDYILDPVSEMELSPQFPVTHRSGSQPVNHKMSSPDVEPVKYVGSNDFDSQGRNRKSPYMPPIPIGSFGRICPNEEKDTQSCAKAMAALADYYKVSFNLMACEKNHHESFHRQCHVRFKPSKTTDFECWVTNAPDGSGRAMAKCRAPWRKDLQANQIRTGYGGGQAQADSTVIASVEVMFHASVGSEGTLVNNMMYCLTFSSTITSNAINRQQGLYGPQQGYGSQQGMYGSPQGMYGAPQGGYGASQGGYGGYGGYGGNPYQGQGYEESASSFQREQATYPVTMIKILTLYCLLLVLISDSQGRNRKSPYMPPIPIGSFGRICPNEEKDTQSCAKAMAALADYYKVSFNLMACEKNHHESFHRQCHVRFKPSKTTDFECWVTNAPDGSGRAMAKCRAPWRKDLQANQIRTGYGGGQAQAGIGIGMPSKLETMGLSKSRLNDRYHSMERIQESVITEDTDTKVMKQLQEDEDIMESVSQRGENRKYSLTGFIKSQYAGKRAAPGSHSSKAQIEIRHSDNKSEGAKSSAMSDTSEAPSLASHVRRVRVPSQASDVDQFLDDLFSPVLDQLSDARSLAASIKGGGKATGVATQQNSQAQSPPGGSFSFNPIVGNSSPVMSGILPPQPLLIPSMPVYNSQGISLPAGNGPTTPTSAGTGDPSSMIAYQANLQQAFLQSAMAQNIQIQQQLFAQNQALQQLLQQRISVTEPPAPWHGPASPGAPALNKSSPTNSKPQGVPVGSPHATFTSVLSELKSRRSSSDSPPPLLIHRSNGGAPPPPPPMPPPPDLADPSEVRPFMDPYGRAKTVRIGKWRWPPPQGDNSDSSFLQFKLKQQRRKHSQELGDPPENGVVEWEEFEMQSETQGPVTMATSTPNLNMNHHNSSTEVHRGSYKSLEVGAARPSPGSVGKLRISSEMKSKLEMVTANHSLRSTDGKNQRPSALPSAMAPNKLDSDRRLLLQQQLAGRWGSMDSVDSRGAGGAVVKEDRSDVQTTNIVRSQVEKVWRGAPPPPVVPHQMLQGVPNGNGPPSRSSSFYDSHSTPPPPIQPVSRDRTPRLQAFQTTDQHHHHAHITAQKIHLEDIAESVMSKTGSSLQVVLQSGEKFPIHSPRARQIHVMLHAFIREGGAVLQMQQESRLTKQWLNEAHHTPDNRPSPSPLHPSHPHHVESRKLSLNHSPTPMGGAVLQMQQESRLTKQWLNEAHHTPDNRPSPSPLHPSHPHHVESRKLSLNHSPTPMLLEQYGVTISNMHTGQHKASTKRAVLDMARHWLMYFSRIFSISGGHQYPDVQLVAISHSGIRLARLDLNHLRVLHNISLGGASFRLLTFMNLPIEDDGKHSLLQFAMHHFRQFENLKTATGELTTGTGHKKSSSDWTWREQLDLVKFTCVPISEPLLKLEPPLAEIAVECFECIMRTFQSKSLNKLRIEDDGKHSLLQFAMHHFRQFENLKTATGELTTGTGHKKSSSDWTWREQLDLVKFTCVPISEPLLKLEPPLAEIAVECFECIMRFMGDLPTTPDLTEVKCVYTILMHCHTHEPLRDEVYCQLMKQTTSNKTESCQRGWRLLSIVAAYFTCSDTLRPFLLKYLETAAYDKRRAFHGTASVCLQNLRKTLRYGGRKNVPSVEEVTAVSAGRNSKRQLYRLPGGSETVINTKSTTVVEDICIEMCQLINVNNDLEMEEFSLYCIVEGDAFTMPLAKEEYILDVTTELHKNQQVFYLIFCRSVWYFPLRLDCQLYVQVLFNQIAPDYLEGLLLVLPNEQIPQDIVYDVAKLAALLHRAADMSHPPAMKETKFLLPKPALTQRDIKPAQWVQMVQSHWTQTAPLHSIQAKAQLLEILSKWPLFGSSFFAIKRNGDQQILALNKHGVHFLNLLTHETISSVPYGDVISTRKVRAESGTLYLEMKCGNLFQQRVARIQTDQAHEIARLIRQYMSLDRQKNVIQ
ncbi:uncharacterized protein LOC103509128, partial [Diaphorina citri]|uniref:Uncharacterized protein LOC103509128 n=1 Tax=Diaphorina citri TaxID=121845 RepID=A0A3Q0IST9_DIACI